MCNLKDVNRGVNRTILQISLLLLLIVFSFRKCIRLIAKITEQRKCLLHNFLWIILKLNPIKRSIPESFKHEYTIFPVPRPSTPIPSSPSSPLPHPLHGWDLDCAESQAHTKLVWKLCMSQFHRKTAIIDQGQGDLSSYLPQSETAKSYLGFERFSGF